MVASTTTERNPAHRIPEHLVEEPINANIKAGEQTAWDAQWVNAQFHPTGQSGIAYLHMVTGAPSNHQVLASTDSDLPWFSQGATPKRFLTGSDTYSTVSRISIGNDLAWAGDEGMVAGALSAMEAAFRRRYFVFVARPSASLEDVHGIGQRLEELKKLEDGWADGMQPAVQWGEGYGRAPSVSALDWLAGQFRSRYRSTLPHPYLYPTPEGGIQVEWSIGSHEVSLEIDLEAYTAEWHSVNIETGKFNERGLNLNDAYDWSWLADELRGLESAS